MSSPELIGRLLRGVADYELGGRGGHGGDSLTVAELAGALHGLGQMQMHLAYAKYAGCDKSALALRDSMLVRARSLAKTQGWRFDAGRPTLENMAAVSVFEILTPPVCGRCHGSGSLIAGSGNNKSCRPCAVCNGFGVLALSGRYIAGQLQISEAAYRKDWAGRYGDLLRFLQALDADIWACLRRI